MGLGPKTLTDDLSPPRRPGINDVGGGQKVNTNNPPDPVSGLDADDINQMSAQIVAVRKVTPLLVISVRYTGGNPIIDSAAFVSDNATFSGGSPNVSIARTGGGAANGDVTISWTAGTFPSLGTSQPWGCVLNDLTGTNRAPSAQAVANGVRVVTTNSAGAATDLAFTVTVG